MKYGEFRHNILRKNKLCRSCINKLCGSKIERRDCNYWMYPDRCSSCGEVRNIVADILPLSRYKVWRIKNAPAEFVTAEDSSPEEENTEE